MKGGVFVVRLFADLLVGLGQDLEVKPIRFMKGGVFVVRLFADLLVGLGQDLEVKPIRFGHLHGN